MHLESILNKQFPELKNDFEILAAFDKIDAVYDAKIKEIAPGRENFLRCEIALLFIFGLSSEYKSRYYDLYKNTIQIKDTVVNDQLNILTQIWNEL